MKLFILCLMLFISSCGSNQKKIALIDKEIKEVPVQKTEIVIESSRELIQNSKSLSEVQKNKLLEIDSSLKAKNAAITEQIERAKIVLVKKIIDPKLDIKDIKIIKKKIYQLDKQRLQNGFDAISQALAIITPPVIQRESPYFDFIFHNYVREM